MTRNGLAEFISDILNMHFLDNLVCYVSEEDLFKVDLGDMSFSAWKRTNGLAIRNTSGFVIHNTSQRGSQMVLMEHHRADRIGIIISHIYRNLDGIRDVCNYCSSGIYPRFSKF